MMNTVPYRMAPLEEHEMQTRAEAFHQSLSQRRSVRRFSDRPIPGGVLDDCVRTAGSAPSGANLQPWHFAVVTSAGVKFEIRKGAEAEEKAFYEERAPADWLEALAPIGTDANKPFLETAPALIAIFAKSKTAGPEGTSTRTYYPKESVGIATGFLIAALHQAGLATLTHTPSPMQFLNRILDRPVEEKPFLLLVTGFPAADCRVPDLNRHSLREISSIH
ncbi:MAG: nitroreductase family protein [Verrucomicrobiota bacterium]